MTVNATLDVNEVGATAFVIAHMRALEKNQPRPLFEDPYAEWFHHELAAAAAEQLRDAHPATWAGVRYRTRFFDAFVRDGITAGARQVVSLGAGLAMRTHLLAADGVAFYEVDQPEVLAFKDRVLRARGVEPCPSLACNYLEVDLPAGLEGIGLDRSLPTLVVWEGNTMYLPRDAIWPLLTQLADGISSLRIAFDYFAVDLPGREFETDVEAEVVARMEAAMGTSFVTGFTDLSVFERETPFTIAESGRILALHEQYEPGVEIEGLGDVVDAYGYCILKTSVPGSP